MTILSIIPYNKHIIQISNIINSEGIPNRSITEVCGEPSTGKSTFLMSLALSVIFIY